MPEQFEQSWIFDYERTVLIWQLRVNKGETKVSFCVILVNTFLIPPLAFLFLGLTMSLNKKSNKSTGYRPEGATEITRMLKHEARVFKALANGISERTGPSPDVTPEKPPFGSVTMGNIPNDPRLRAGFESGYLGNSRNTCNNMAEQREWSQSVNGGSLVRSRSFTGLNTVTEEPEGAFIHQNLPTNNRTGQNQQCMTSKEKSSKITKVSKQLGFDLKNLRLSFRKKKASVHKEPHSDYITCDYIDQVIGPSPDSPAFQNRCYFDAINGFDCEKCKRLLKDPRFCQCPRPGFPRQLPLQSLTANQVPGRLPQGQPAQKVYQNGSYLSHLALTEGQKHGLEQSIQQFGTVKRRTKVSTKESVCHLSEEEIQKTVARFSLAPDSEFSDILGDFTKDLPPDSHVTLRDTLKLDYLQNKWISDIIVTDKGEYVIVDSKQVYVVDKVGRLKRNIGNKGSCLVKCPVSICSNKNGSIVITDKILNSLHVFSTKGQHVRTIEHDSFVNLAGAICHGNDHIFVINHESNRIMVLDEKSSVLLYSIPTTLNSSRGNEVFTSPVSIAANPLTQDILLGDDARQSVIALAMLGQLKWEFRPALATPRPFYPNSLCADLNGYIFASDLYNCRVYMLDSCGKCLRSLLSSDMGLRTGPSCIAVDRKGQIVVADEERTLKVFSYGKGGFTMQRRVSFCPNK